MYADSFYIRPIAAWVPHKLLPNFVPTCPHCKKNKYVNVDNARWQNSPKILFGLKGNKYLDTMLYPCNNCKRQFTGYNPDSMREDSSKFIGFFNYHFSGRFAVDEELYSFICSCWEMPTPAIHRILNQMTVDTYLNDYALYLHAVRSKRVKVDRPNVTVNDWFQRTLHSSLTDAPRLTPAARTRNILKADLRSAKIALSSAEFKRRDKVCFKALRTLKKGRNYSDALLPGIGYKKLDELIAANITNARELVDYAGVPRAWCVNRALGKVFEGYRKKAVQLFLERDRELARCKGVVEDLEEQLDEAESQVTIEQSINDQMTVEGEREPEPANEESLPPLFSKMTEVKGYNA